MSIHARKNEQVKKMKKVKDASVFVCGVFMRKIVCLSLFSLFSLVLTTHATVTFSNAYRSPRNVERAVRRNTTLIILHTTEAPFTSVNKLSANGECHYLVNTDGVVYRIIDHRRVAFHAGRSMWNGRSNVDDFSVGIEVVGNHNKRPNAAQMRALAGLVKELQAIYTIPDQAVLSHSQVAYGAPNRWQTRNHRGRKRCGMLFATWSVRQQLGLAKKPASDPDIRAGRLVSGDPELHAILYAPSPTTEAAKVTTYIQHQTPVITAQRSAWDIARDQYNQPATTYVFPNGTRQRGDQITNWGAIPAGTRVILSDTAAENPVEPVKTVGQNTASAASAARDEAGSPSTFYILPNGTVHSGDKITAEQLASLPHATRILVGYAKAGPITPTTRAYDLCGPRWNAKDTYYLYPHGLLKPGSEMNEKNISTGILVFYKN
jgi:hypothetical protein